MAGLGAGLWRDLAELEGLTSGGATYEPESQAPTDWTGRYRAWCRAVEQSLAWSEP